MRAKKAFWNSRRIKIISSMPCRELVQALEDGQRRTAKELSLMTGRTPGALHSPLQRLCKDQILIKGDQAQTRQGRGRPAQIFHLNPEASRELPKMEARESTPLDHTGNEAALRMLNRKVKKALSKNKALMKENKSPLASLCSIEYGFLTEGEVQRIEKKFLEIQTMLAKKRSNPNGKKKRFRVGMVLVQDLATD